MTGPQGYERRPTPAIQALQWTGENDDEVYAWVGEQFQSSIEGGATLFVKTQEAFVTLAAGDWIVADHIGFYRIPAGEFVAQYDLSENAEHMLHIVLDRRQSIGAVAEQIFEAMRIAAMSNLPPTEIRAEAVPAEKQS